MSSNRLHQMFKTPRQQTVVPQNNSSPLISRTAVNDNGERLLIRASSNGTMDGLYTYLRSICHFVMMDDEFDCNLPNVEHDSGEGGCAPCAPPITQYSQAQLLSCNGLSSNTYLASIACGSQQIEAACAWPQVDSCAEPTPNPNPSTSKEDPIQEGIYVAGAALAFVFLLCCIRYLCRRARHPEDFEELPASPRHRGP